MARLTCEEGVRWKEIEAKCFVEILHARAWKTDGYGEILKTFGGHVIVASVFMCHKISQLEFFKSLPDSNG